MSASAPEQAYIIISVLASAFGTLASLITIHLIHSMKIYSGHVTLVLLMTYYQLLYDVTLFFSNVNLGYYITVCADFFQIFSGISGSLVSNWVAFIAFYVVYSRCKFDVMRHYSAIFWSCFWPGLADAVLYFVAEVPRSSTNAYLVAVAILYVYYSLRLASIGINFILIGATFYKIQQMLSSKQKKTEQEEAIHTLIRRMVYYPIIQAIGRSGYAWYEAQFGDDIQPSSGDPLRYFCLLYATIVAPSVSIGYLVIFLIMQPKAYQHFKQLYCLWPRSTAPAVVSAGCSSGEGDSNVVRETNDTLECRSHHRKDGSVMSMGNDTMRKTGSEPLLDTVSTRGKRDALVDWERFSSFFYAAPSLYDLKDDEQLEGYLGEVGTGKRDMDLMTYPTSKSREETQPASRTKESFDGSNLSGGIDSHPAMNRSRSYEIRSSRTAGTGGGDEESGSEVKDGMGEREEVDTQRNPVHPS